MPTLLYTMNEDEYQKVIDALGNLDCILGRIDYTLGNVWYYDYSVSNYIRVRSISWILWCNAHRSKRYL
jgi:hypothetical protein